MNNHFIFFKLSVKIRKYIRISVRRADVKMKFENPFSRHMLFICNCICIILASKYTYLQIKIYFDNEDVSSISFQKFENGNEDKYPTYTICFEDSFIRQIYKTQHVVTGCPPYPGCPEIGEPILLAKLENGMIRFWEEPYYRDLMFREKRSSNLMKSETKFSVANQSSPMKQEYNKIKGPRHKRSTPTFIHTDDSIYSLNGFGNEVIMLKQEENTFVIAPEQYQQLLMGVNQIMNYSAQHDGIYNFNYNVSDLWKFSFNSTAIDLENFLLRFDTKTSKSTVYGWHEEEYKSFEGYCEARHNPSCQMFGGTRDCNVEDSFIQNLEKMKNLEYPFEKSYQDPLKICYTQKQDSNRSIKTEQITLDLKKMFFGDDLQIFRLGSSLPFMTIYVHQRGQFIGEIGKPVASFSPLDIAAHCKDIYIHEYDDNYNYQRRDNDENCHGTKIEIDISQVTILNSRHDAQIPCNKTLQNEDVKTLEFMQDKIGCSPMFWKGFSSSKGFGGCTKLDDYTFLRNATSEFTNFGDIQDEFEPPCETMYIETNVKTQQGRSLQNKGFDYYYDNEKGYCVPNDTKTGLYLDMTFYMAPDNFQNIVNNRDFTIENCWAGIGGFVGIFVGVSLMQIPELIIQFFDFVKRKY